jgi:ATF/CREB family transcription factor
MLSGPANDYFGDTSHTLRGGFTPNESSLRTGLTPGGSGSMFPAPSPNSQALYASLASGGATPGTLDFHRTAISAAAAKNRDSAPPATSQAQDVPNGAAVVKTEAKPASGAFDPHDNDAANGLFMLAQGAQQRNGTQTTNQQFPVGGTQSVHAHPPAAKANNSSAQTNGNGSVGSGSARGVSETASGASDDMEEQVKPNTRGKGKRGSTAATNGRRKAEEPPAKQPASKKAKGLPMPMPMDDEEPSDDDDEDMMKDGMGGKSKMTDEEKRRNFLERNR